MVVGGEDPLSWWWRWRADAWCGGGLEFLGEGLARSLRALAWGRCSPQGFSVLTVFPYLAGAGSSVVYFAQVVASFFTASEQLLVIFGILAVLGGSSGGGMPRVGAGLGRGRLLALLFFCQFY